MICPLKKEVCQPCGRFINIGHLLLECENCEIIIHAHCHKTAKFMCMNELWVCSTCQTTIEPRYNPFKSLCEVDQDSDKFYNDDGTHGDITLQSMSSILESCAKYTKLELKKIIERLQENTDNKAAHVTASTFFLNIDGNKTNFDHLLLELKSLYHEFTAITRYCRN